MEQYSESGLDHRAKLLRVFRVLEQPCYEDIDSVIVMMQIAQAYFKRDRPLDEGDILITKADPAKPCIQFILCRR